VSDFDARAVIRLDHLRHNYNKATEAAPTSKVMAVIKANAYGHGALAIAEALRDADAFAVARVKEAIELRNAGFNHPMTLLEGVATSEGTRLAKDYDLDVVIHHPQQIELLKNVSLRCWFKIETGMNRLGLHDDQLDAVVGAVPRSQRLGLFSHFSDADDPEHPKNLAQRERFDRWRNRLELPGGMSGSAAILGGHGTDLEWIRPGVMLYGINPFSTKPAPLKPVMKLEAPVISVREVSAGETVGYGSRWVAKTRTKLAVVAIGYADGYPREMPTGTPVRIHDEDAQIVGRISMDMLTVAVSAGSKVKVGDWAELWGDQLSVEFMGERCDTIAYTLVCGISQRVDRVYVGQQD